MSTFNKNEARPQHRQPRLRRRAFLPAAFTQWALLGPNLVLIALVMIAPIVVLGRISFNGYEPGRGMVDTWQVSNYTIFLFDSFYQRVLWTTVAMGAVVSLLCVVLGYPLAYALSRLRGLKRSVFYFCILMPLLTGAVIRTFGWMILLGNNGFINRTLIALNVIDEPIRLMYNMTGVIIALTEVLLPFMVISLDTALLNIKPFLYEAAENLGATRTRIFFSVTLPLSLPGVVSGCVLVFAGAISAFVTPTLIAGANVTVMATLIYQQAMALFNWPFGAAIALIMLVAILALLLMSLKLTERRRGN
jgi:putative spermidine/putrescine transport system permease protein